MPVNKKNRQSAETTEQKVFFSEEEETVPVPKPQMSSVKKRRTVIVLICLLLVVIGIVFLAVQTVVINKDSSDGYYISWFGLGEKSFDKPAYSSETEKIVKEVGDCSVEELAQQVENYYVDSVAKLTQSDVDNYASQDGYSGLSSWKMATADYGDYVTCTAVEVEADQEAIECHVWAQFDKGDILMHWTYERENAKETFCYEKILSYLDYLKRNKEK